MGEQIAQKLLRNAGYLLLELNWTTPMGEIDIIAKDKERIVFVEVRTTSNTRFGYGVQSINKRKQEQVRKLALLYLKANKIEDSSVRFDVVSVLLNSCHPDIKHLVAAF